MAASSGRSPLSEDQTLDLSIKRDLTSSEDFISEVIGTLQEEPIDFSTKKSEYRPVDEPPPQIQSFGRLLSQVFCLLCSLLQIYISHLHIYIISIIVT